MPKKFLVLFFAALAFFLPAAAAGAADLGLTATPGQIDIGLNFKGASLELTGNVPQGSDIYLKVESPPGTVALNRKGKVGPFWMTVDNVQAENIPKIYEVFSTGHLAALPQDLRDKMEIGEGYPYLKEHARVTRKAEGEKEVLHPDEAKTFVDGLITIYEKKGYYKVGEENLPVENGQFRATIQIPSSIPPGQTQITAYAVQGGRIIASQEFPLQVNSIGMVNWIRSEATTNGPFYGLIAVIVALIVGLATGTLFNAFGRRKGLQADGGAH